MSAQRLDPDRRRRWNRDRRRSHQRLLLGSARLHVGAARRHAEGDPGGAQRCSVCRPDAPSTSRAGRPSPENRALSFCCWAVTPVPPTAAIAGSITGEAGGGGGATRGWPVTSSMPLPTHRSSVSPALIAVGVAEPVLQRHCLDGHGGVGDAGHDRAQRVAGLDLADARGRLGHDGGGRCEVAPWSSWSSLGRRLSSSSCLSSPERSSSLTATVVVVDEDVVVVSSVVSGASDVDGGRSGFVGRSARRRGRRCTRRARRPTMSAPRSRSRTCDRLCVDTRFRPSSSEV